MIHHLVDGVKEFGPTHSTWMYAYERFNSWLHRRVMNRRYPESTLMETYAVGIVILILHIWKSQIEIKVIFHYIWSASPSSAHYSTEL